MKTWMTRLIALTALAVPAVFFAGLTPVADARPADAEWGTIKGKVIWDGPPPANPKAIVDKDKAHCLAKGDILRNAAVVNPKNKGVRWVMVFLGDPADVKNKAWKPAKIHPAMEKFAPTFEIDQPCCVFEPRLVVMREGQNLVVKNSGKVAHNFAIAAKDGPTANPLIPAGASAEVKGFVPTNNNLPIQYNCSIHGWMKGWIGVLPHPYYAVTDADGNFEIKNAPPGKFRLHVWHEEIGWVVMKSATDRGIKIEVKGGGTTDVGTVKAKPSDD